MRSEINNLVEFDEFRVDTRKAVLWFNGELVDVPMKAVELLSVLVRRPGEVVSKERLLTEVWGGSFVEESVLSQNIYRLRKIFRESGVESDLILTVPRRGYMFVGTIDSAEFEEISIEHERIERTLIVEDDRRTGTAVPSRRISAGSRTVVAGLLLVFVAVLVGAGVWYRKGEDRSAAAPIIENVRFERVTESGRAIEPAISNDNRNIAYIRSASNEHSIVLRNLATGSETVVVGPKDHELASLSFSADSNHLYFIAREKDLPDSTVYRVPLFGGTERKILTGVRHFVSVSPSGKRLAYVRYDAVENKFNLMESDADGLIERKIATRTPPEFYHDWNTYPSWSPDETRIVMPAHSQPGGSRITSESYFVEIDVKSGTETRIKHPEWNGIGNAFWTSGGDSLVVSARENADSFTQLWILKYPSGEAFRLTNDTNDYRDFKLSADSKSIVAANISSSADLFVLDAADLSDGRRLTKQSLANYGRWGLDWMPDGGHVVAVKNNARNDGNLFKVNVETGEEIQLTHFENSSVLSPRVAPDGTVFFAANDSGRWHIWRVGKDGTGLTRVTSGSAGENYPDLSHDGRYLYFSRPGRAPTAVWRKLLPDGREEELESKVRGPARVSPTNPDLLASIFYARDAPYPWTVVADDLGDAEGAKDLLFEPENHAIAWDHTGTGLFFGKKSLNVTNLWFKPLDDVPARQVTDYDSGKVIGVAVSRDGKRIVLSRESTVSNLFLIKGFDSD